MSVWNTGQHIRTVDGEHDLFGDGTVVCRPTYGHTPGHQSLRVRTEKAGEFVLCATPAISKARSIICEPRASSPIEKRHSPCSNGSGRCKRAA